MNYKLHLLAFALSGMILGGGMEVLASETGEAGDAQTESENGGSLAQDVEPNEPDDATPGSQDGDTKKPGADENNGAQPYALQTNDAVGDAAAQPAGNADTVDTPQEPEVEVIHINNSNFQYLWKDFGNDRHETNSQWKFHFESGKKYVLDEDISADTIGEFNEVVFNNCSIDGNNHSIEIKNGILVFWGEHNNNGGPSQTVDIDKFPLRTVNLENLNIIVNNDQKTGWGCGVRFEHHTTTKMDNVRLTVTEKIQTGIMLGNDVEIYAVDSHISASDCASNGIYVVGTRPSEGKVPIGSDGVYIKMTGGSLILNNNGYNGLNGQYKFQKIVDGVLKEIDLPPLLDLTNVNVEACGNKETGISNAYLKLKGSLDADGMPLCHFWASDNGINGFDGKCQNSLSINAENYEIRADHNGYKQNTESEVYKPEVGGFGLSVSSNYPAYVAPKDPDDPNDNPTYPLFDKNNSLADPIPATFKNCRIFANGNRETGIRFSSIGNLEYIKAIIDNSYIECIGNGDNGLFAYDLEASNTAFLINDNKCKGGAYIQPYDSNIMEFNAGAGLRLAGNCEFNECTFEIKNNLGTAIRVENVAGKSPSAVIFNNSKESEISRNSSNKTVYPLTGKGVELSADEFGGYGGGLWIQSGASVTLSENMSIHNNHAGMAGDDIYLETGATLNLVKVQPNLILDDDGKDITGWFVDKEGNRWNDGGEDLDAAAMYLLLNEAQSGTVSDNDNPIALKAAHGAFFDITINYLHSLTNAVLKDPFTKDDFEIVNNIDEDRKDYMTLDMWNKALTIPSELCPDKISTADKKNYFLNPDSDKAVKFDETDRICTLYYLGRGTVTVHYVDTDGKELIPDITLKDADDNPYLWEGTKWEVGDNKKDTLVIRNSNPYRLQKVEGDLDGTMAASDIEVTLVYANTGTVTVHYVDTEGNVIKDPEVLLNGKDKYFLNGEDWDASDLVAATIAFDGKQYELIEDDYILTGTMGGSDVEITLVYNPQKVEEPEPVVPEPVNPEPDVPAVLEAAVPVVWEAAPSTRAKEEFLTATGEETGVESVAGGVVGGIVAALTGLWFGKRKKH